MIRKAILDTLPSLDALPYVTSFGESYTKTIIEQIVMSKRLETPPNSHQYVLNLEEVVRDLSSIPFRNRNIEFCSRSVFAFYSDDYNIEYGTTVKKDKSGVSYLKNVDGYKICIKTLRQLKRHIKKAKKQDNPDFKIQYRKIEFVEHKTSLDQLFEPSLRSKPTGGCVKIEKIFLNEPKSSTNITAVLYWDGLVEIKIEYDNRSSNKEINKINESMINLIKRGYKKEDKLTY